MVTLHPLTLYVTQLARALHAEAIPKAPAYVDYEWRESSVMDDVLVLMVDDCLLADVTRLSR